MEAYYDHRDSGSQSEIPRQVIDNLTLDKVGKIFSATNQQALRNVTDKTIDQTLAFHQDRQDDQRLIDDKIEQVIAAITNPNESVNHKIAILLEAMKEGATARLANDHIAATYIFHYLFGHLYINDKHWDAEEKIRLHLIAKLKELANDGR